MGGVSKAHFKLGFIWPIFFFKVCSVLLHISSSCDVRRRRSFFLLVPFALRAIVVYMLIFGCNDPGIHIVLRFYF